MNKVEEMNNYTIKDMETLSGIKAHTIRIWEKRYGLLSPNRTSTNIRFYTDEQLRKLLNVSILIKHGYKISKVSKYSNNSIQTEVLKLNGKSNGSNSIIDQLIVYMVNFDKYRFEELLEKEIHQSGFEQTILNVVFPLFDKVGVFWQTGSVFPAQEHFVSNLVRQCLVQESSKFNNYSSTKTVLFFLKSGELHELSLLFYNYLALKSGYKTIYLGQNVPFEDLVRILVAHKVDSIFTAFINAINKEDLEAYLEKLSLLENKKKAFVTGQQVKRHEPNLPRNFKVVPDIQTFNKYFGMIN